jgi:hypothetical protein
MLQNNIVGLQIDTHAGVIYTNIIFVTSDDKQPESLALATMRHSCIARKLIDAL